MPAKKSALTAAVVCVMAVSGLAGCKSGGSADASHSGKSGQSGRSGGAGHSGGSGHTDKGQGKAKGKDKENASRPDNGITKQSAGRIGDRAAAAMKSVSSATFKGHMKSSGKPLALDLSMARGDKCTGSIGRGEEGTASIRKKGDASYFKADNAFWQSMGADKASAAKAQAKLKGRWIRMPKSATEPSASGGGNPVGFCKLSSTLEQLKGDDVSGYAKGKPTTVAGQQAVPLSKKKNGGTETAYVAAHGKPYILKLTKRGGSDSGEMAFSDFGEPVQVKLPPKNKQVSPEELKKISGGV